MALEFYLRLGNTVPLSFMTGCVKHNQIFKLVCVCVFLPSQNLSFSYTSCTIFTLTFSSQTVRQPMAFANSRIFHYVVLYKADKTLLKTNIFHLRTAHLKQGFLLKSR